MDLKALKKQFHGRRFGELILHHRKKADMHTIISAIRGVTHNLPKEAQPLVESWIDQINSSARSEQFWRQDCGDALESITTAASVKLRAVGVEPSTDDLFNMFQIIVLNFAYSTYRFSQSKEFIQKALGVGFFGRLFG